VVELLEREQKMESSIEVKRAIARAELQHNLTSAQGVYAKMMEQLRREGVAPKAIMQRLAECGAELEHDIHRMDCKLEPDSGTTQEKAIPVRHPLQELLLLNEIKAEPLYYKRLKADNGRHYDEYSVLRETAEGTQKETVVWFDITACYDKFVNLTKRTAQTKDEALASGVCFACDTVKEHNAFWVCRGCGMARYCNKKCQKRHWKEGHKEFCTHFRNNNNKP
jgi:hypothetical protein